MPRKHPLDRLREICLALPETTEKVSWESTPTFRVRDKIFAMQTTNDGRVSMWCKAEEGGQEILVGADPERFFVPPYVGHRGWIGINLDRGTDWAQVTALVEESYRMTAPKRLLAALDGR